MADEPEEAAEPEEAPEPETAPEPEAFEDPEPVAEEQSQPLGHQRYRVRRYLLILLVLFGADRRGRHARRLPRSPTLGLDLQGGLEVVLEARPEAGQELTDEDLDRSVEIIRQRVDRIGVSEPEIRTQEPNQIVVDLAGRLRRPAGGRADRADGAARVLRPPGRRRSPSPPTPTATRSPAATLLPLLTARGRPARGNDRARVVPVRGGEGAPRRACGDEGGAPPAGRGRRGAGGRRVLRRSVEPGGPHLREHADRRRGGGNAAVPGQRRRDPALVLPLRVPAERRGEPDPAS